MDVTITDNFLPDVDFLNLKGQLTGELFPWYFSPFISAEDVEILPTPGMYKHMIYYDGTPTSQFYTDYVRIFRKALDNATLFRIRINQNFRLPEPYYSLFHVDEQPREEGNGVWIVPSGNRYVPMQKGSEWVTSVFYVNTNNGYTELEDGTKFESIANRFVTFPLSTYHRMVTQTDEQIRVLINFTYMKPPEEESHGT